MSKGNQEMTKNSRQSKLEAQYSTQDGSISPSQKLPLEIVKAGDHCDLRISRQMLPLLLIFG